jgi:hypothetical protein
MKAGRKPKPKQPAPMDVWYNMIAKAWGTYAFPAPKPTKETQPQTVWRHEL